jgi:hypothetical protein
MPTTDNTSAATANTPNTHAVNRDADVRAATSCTSGEAPKTTIDGIATTLCCLPIRRSCRFFSPAPIVILIGDAATSSRRKSGLNHSPLSTSVRAERKYSPGGRLRTR